MAIRFLHLLEIKEETDWQHIARDEQKPPQGDWTTWLILGGRGAGKTRAGAEWIKAVVEGGGAKRIALVGESYQNVREVMVEGISGLLAISPEEMKPTWLASRHILLWPNGATAHCFSAEDPEGLRGYQFDTAWSDELAAWHKGERTWNNLQLCLRLSGASGERPRQVITTTPRPVPNLKTIMKRSDTVITHMTTWENEENLAAAFLQQIICQYEGTRIGRQELNGELLEDFEGALWTRDMIEAARTETQPEFDRVVVAVDPPITSGENADECGIIIAGKVGEGDQAQGYIIADHSDQGLSPLGWAKRVVQVYRDYHADCIVAEANQGGDMVSAILCQIDHTVPVKLVRANKSKKRRAEPVAALYERGKVKHAAPLVKLEDQMVSYGAIQNGMTHSPDRLDAMVWAMDELLLTPQARPSVTFT